MSETTQNSDAAAFVAHWARVGPLLTLCLKTLLRDEPMQNSTTVAVVPECVN